MSEPLPVASLSERVRSGAATVVATVIVAIGATLVVGLLLFGVVLATGQRLAASGAPSPLDGGGLAGPLSGSAWSSLADATPGWLAPVSFLLVLVTTWLASCRIGRGTPGDAVMSLTTQTPSGETPPRWRTMLRTGVPLGILGVASLSHQFWIGVLVVAALWAPAFVRTDRRTAFDLVAGVRTGTNAPAKGDYAWRSPDHADHTDHTS